MGEYNEFKPQDDLGHSSDDDELGALTAQYTPYSGYGPSLGPSYPHGPYGEPDMGFEWGGWRHRREHGRHRGFFARLFGFGRHEDQMGVDPPSFQQGGYGAPAPPQGYGAPRAPMGGGRQYGPPPSPRRRGWGQQPMDLGQPGNFHAMADGSPGSSSWERWQIVHPGSSYSDYQNWHNQYGDSSAINGEW